MWFSQGSLHYGHDVYSLLDSYRNSVVSSSSVTCMQCDLWTSLSFWFSEYGCCLDDTEDNWLSQWLVHIMRSFDDGMRACVIEAGEMSELLDVINGTKQRCILALLLFCIFFTMMLLVTWNDCDLGVNIHIRHRQSRLRLRVVVSRKWC